MSLYRRRKADKKFLRLSQILKTLSEGNHVLICAIDEDELFQKMCDVIVKFGGYRMAWIGIIKHDENKTIHPVACAGYGTDYLDGIKVSWGDNPRGRGPSGMSIRTGVPQFNNDVRTNPAMGPWRESALARGYLSSISMPLRDKTGVLGAVTIYAGETNAFGPDEVKLLVELSEDVSFGVSALRMRREKEEMERILLQSQKMDALGQLTGGIAHDFNNLLQVIYSNLDLSLRLLDGTSALAGHLKNAMAGAEHGAKLTHRLLSFARRQPLSPESVRVDRLVGDLIVMLRRTLNENIDIELEKGDGLWTALVDSGQLQNAILNLAINARDAMPQGGKLTIELNNALLDANYAASHGEVTPGQYIMIEVKDTGTGMPTEILEHIFEPFFTTKPEGVGTGLGLPMVYGFVKQSGGHIDISSNVGQGTSVKLYLPRTQQKEAQRAVEDIDMADGNGERILVVEDNEGVKAAVVAQLEKLGYRTLAVSNGKEAIDILEQRDKFDLLFADVMLPGAFNGRQLADQVRIIAPKMPVLLTSGYTENTNINRDWLEDTGSTLLRKPYRLAELARAVRSLFEKREVPESRSYQVDDRLDAPCATLAPNNLGTQFAAAAHILLVEDDDTIRYAMGEILQDIGYRITMAARPSEALKLFGDDPSIQIIISDYTLPEMNGVDLTRTMLACKPDLPVIIVTGQKIAVDNLQYPSISVLLKPVQSQDIVVAIEKALSRRSGRCNINDDALPGCARRA
jgi:signal transduction histidine kinase/DNA-binding response OmpR family regulator